MKSALLLADNDTLQMGGSCADNKALPEKQERPFLPGFIFFFKIE